jgi:hypothetical protein
MLDDPPFDMRRDPAPGDFDFWQFRHLKDELVV